MLFPIAILHCIEQVNRNFENYINVISHNLGKNTLFFYSYKKKVYVYIGIQTFTIHRTLYRKIT